MLGILHFLQLMNFAINFENQPCLGTVEVHNIAVNDMLAAELKSIECLVPNGLP